MGQTPLPWPVRSRAEYEASTEYEVRECTVASRECSDVCSPFDLRCPFDIQGGTYLGYGKVTYTRGALRLQFFTNVLDGQAPNLLLPNPATGRSLQLDFRTQTYDGEIGHAVVLGNRHRLSYGGNVRQNNFDIPLAPLGEDRLEVGGYLQDEIFWDWFRLVLGAPEMMIVAGDNPARIRSEAAFAKLCGAWTASLHPLRGLHRYCRPVRLPLVVHRRRASVDFPTRPAAAIATGDQGISRFSCEVFPYVPGVSDRAGSHRLSRYRGARWGLPLLLTASAPRRKCLSRLHTRPARAPVNASTLPSQVAPHDSGSVWVASPSPYDSFIHDTSPV